MQGRKSARAGVEPDAELAKLAVAAPGALWTIDRELHVTHIAGSDAASLGLRPDRIVSRTAAVIRAHREALAGRTTEFEAARDRRVFHARVAPLREDAGEIVGAAGVAVDVTGIARAGAELRQHNEQLEYRVVARARELDRGRDEARQLHARISHELQTPLNTILGLAQLLEADEPDLQRREELERIIRAARHLLALIDEVLDVARVEAETLPLALRVVQLAESVGEAVDLLGGTALRSDVRLMRAPPDDVRVLADADRLLDVLLSLLERAIASNRPGGTIEVSWAVRSGTRVRVSVRDTGPGIPPDALSEVFEPFRRAGAGDGTRLRLHLARRLVEAMGGTMGAESTVGSGSTFWFELQAADEGRTR